MESLRPIRHRTAVDHCSSRADSAVANPGSTKENVVPGCATSMCTLEVSRNSRNSSDLGFSSASRSTFLHTTFPQRSWILTSQGRFFTQKLLSMLNQSDAQTEDGHAMVKSDVVHPFRNLSHAVRGCDKTVNKCVLRTRLTCPCHGEHQ